MTIWHKVAARPQGTSLFALLRRMEARHRDLPRLGRAARPQDEPVRLGQVPALSFAPGELDSVETDGERPKVNVRVLGLFGPNGALPLPMTEYVWDRLHNHRDATWAQFADVFHHRMLALFYRAWAEGQPAVTYDRPDEDNFASYIGALGGYGQAGLLTRDTVQDEAKLHFTGLLARGSRDAGGLRRILADYFRVPVAIEPFAFQWLPLPESQRTRLGARDMGAQLGGGTVLGARVPDRQHCFAIELGPMSYADYRRFLPEGESLPRLRDWIRNYLGLAFEWTLQLKIKPESLPQPKLDGSVQLGRDSWLGRNADKTSVSGWRLG